MSWNSIVFSVIGYAAFNYLMFVTITRSELKLSKVYFLANFFISGISLGLYPFIIGNNAADESSITLISVAYFVAVLIGVFIFSWNWFIKIILQSFRDVDDKAKAINRSKEDKLI